MNIAMTAGVLPDFLAWLWRASWQASVVLVLVLVAQWVARRQLPPRWRHALWFLVFVRLALPWSPASPMSLFNWLPAGHAPSPQVSQAPPTGVVADSRTDPDGAEPAGALPAAAAPSEPRGVSWLALVPAVWLGGALLLPACLLVNTLLLAHKVRRIRPITDGALLDLLEDCKQEMEVSAPLRVVETSAVASPSLFGFIRPCLLLPAGFTRSFSREELRYVFLHELAHLRRGDIPLNWLTTAILALHWFNPLAWYAANRMRADGELACDALALSHAGEAAHRSYGETILKLLEQFSRSAPVPGLMGILEDKNQMKRRIIMIAKFKKTNEWPVAAMALFAALTLLTLTDAQRPSRAAEEGGAGAPSGTPGGPPRIVSTIPKVGDTEVAPTLGEITVKFDRDMAGGFSWTGGGPEYPPVREGLKPRWIDKRTCILPVKLEPARFYRVGINSKSYQNFRSAEGVPAQASAIYFTTEGASDALKRKVQKPSIVGINPKNGDQNVDPALTELRITFNVPMSGGFSWTGGGPNFPTIPEGKKPFWSEDHLTCVLPVELKPGWEYRLGLNSPSHKNFQSAGGVPLDPVTYSFKTRN